MSASEEVDVDSLDLITAKLPAEQYVLLWLMAMLQAGVRRFTFRRSAPLPSLAEIGAMEELVDLAPPPTSVAFDDVLKKLKAMASLDPVVHNDAMGAEVELNISGRRALAHLRFGERADDPWCEVTMEPLEP